MNEFFALPAGEQTGGSYEEWSEQLELESLRYSRALQEEEEARLK